MLLFHVGGFLVLYAVMRLQAYCRSIRGQSAVAGTFPSIPAISFITNTSGRTRAAKARMSYLVQMLGAEASDFLSRQPVSPAWRLIRASRVLVRRSAFLGRCDTLHPLCAAADLRCLHAVPGLAGIPRRSGAMSTPPRWNAQADHRGRSGGLASRDQEACTNGGGFFKPRRAPFENRGPVEFVQMISIFTLGAALTNVLAAWSATAPGLGDPVGDGRAVHPGVIVTYWRSTHLRVAGARAHRRQYGSKEVRFGIVASACRGDHHGRVCGAVNAMHDSFTALGGMIP